MSVALTGERCLDWLLKPLPGPEAYRLEPRSFDYVTQSWQLKDETPVDRAYEDVNVAR